MSWAKECLDGAKGAPAVMNAANEAAVGAFLAQRVSFDRIFGLVRGAIDRFGGHGYDGVDDLRELCSTVLTWVESQVQVKG
jgi:1-deoxy-D-xylulose-5-phosphate reductoisomerase